MIGLSADLADTLVLKFSIKKTGAILRLKSSGVAKDLVGGVVPAELYLNLDSLILIEIYLRPKPYSKQKGYTQHKTHSGRLADNLTLIIILHLTF